MNGLPYYKAYPRDFIEGTIGMSFELKGCYRLILDLIYMQGGKLPDNARYISGLLGCSIRMWKNMRDQLVALDKLQVSGEFLTNYRAVSELESLAKLQDKQRENRSRPNKNKGLESPETDHTEPDTEPYKEEVVVGAPAGDLLEQVHAALGIGFNGRIGTYWLPPSATIHVGRWVTELGLTPEQIIQVCKENRKQHSEAPKGPKALDFAMKALSQTLSAPRAAEQPKPQESRRVQFELDTFNNDGSRVAR